MQQGVALLKELRDNMIGFADQRIEKISIEVAKHHTETEKMLEEISKLMEEHGMLDEYNRLYSKLMLYFQHFGRNCYMQGFRDHVEIKKIHDLGVDAPM